MKLNLFFHTVPETLLIAKMTFKAEHESLPSEAINRHTKPKSAIFKFRYLAENYFV